METEQLIKEMTDYMFSLTRENFPDDKEMVWSDEILITQSNSTWLDDYFYDIKNQVKNLYNKKCLECYIINIR